MRVHVVDGTYELFRAYYGAPERAAPDGAEVGAVRALLRSLLVLLGERDVTHVGVAFDHVIESFRNRLYAGYKTGEGIDAKLYAQFHPAEDACRALGVVVWPMVEFEADDALATAAHRYGADARVEQVVICSPDKDLAQCVRGARIVCRDRMRNTVMDEAGVVAKFGVPPSSIADWLALVGDNADGYPGIARWGAKSAAAVLAAYRTIDAIPDDVRAWTVKVRGADALAANLRAQRADARLFRELAILRTDAPLAESLDQLRYAGPDRAALSRWAERLGDVDLVAHAERIGDSRAKS